MVPGGVVERPDRNVKDVFLNRADSAGKGFPNQPTSWWKHFDNRSKWIRARPKHPSSRHTHPLLVRPGSPTHVDPDGMWILVGRAFPTDNTKQEGFWVDVMAFESMRTSTNFQKDRSRYFPTIGSYQVRIPKGWLEEAISYQGGGRNTRPRWQSMGSFNNIDFITESYIRFPVRRLSVMFCLSNDLYQEVRHNIIPEGHEYFMKHSSMGSRSNIKTHVMKMDPENHWL